MSEDINVVDVTLCVGMFGVCVIGTLGDEYEAIFGQLCTIGAEEWFKGLPEHGGPDEGIYTIECRLLLTDVDFSYLSVKVKEIANA